MLFKIILIAICISIFFNNCSENENFVTVQKSIDFKTGIIEAKYNYKGLYYNKDVGKEIVYFSDGFKFIKTFSLNGELLDSIPLAHVLNVLGKIGFILPFAKDTILCGDEDGKKIATISNIGNVYHIINLDSVYTDAFRGLYHAYRFIPYQQKSLNKLLLKTHLSFYDLLTRENKLDLDFLSMHKFYCKKFNDIPYFLLLKNIFSDTISYRFNLYDFYKTNFAENDAAMYFGSNFKETNDFIFLLCSPKSKIIKINPDNFDIIKEVIVESKFTNVMYSFSYEYMINSVEEFTEKSKFRGSIAELFFDKNSNKYLTIVMHSVKSNEEYDNCGGFNYRPFSIIVYDQNFENQREYKFNANTYNCLNSFMTSEGLMIQRKAENLNINNYGTQTFDLLKFN